MRSSASRERWREQSEQAEANSTNKSRSATASIPLGVNLGSPHSSTKPSALATSERSRGRVEPAIAPEPSGQTLAWLATLENVRGPAQASPHKQAGGDQR